MVLCAQLAARLQGPGVVQPTSVGGGTIISPAGFSLEDANGTTPTQPHDVLCRKAAAVQELFTAADLDIHIAHSRAQIESSIYSKLLINAVINPLTAIHGVPNGHLLLPAYAPRVAGLCAETYSVLLGAKKVCVRV